MTAPTSVIVFAVATIFLIGGAIAQSGVIIGIFAPIVFLDLAWILSTVCLSHKRNKIRVTRVHDKPEEAETIRPIGLKMRFNENDDPVIFKFELKDTTHIEDLRTCLSEHDLELEDTHPSYQIQTPPNKEWWKVSGILTNICPKYFYVTYTSES